MESRLLILLLFTLLINQGKASGTGGKCYSAMQTTYCQRLWENLWSATNERQYGSICKHFLEVHQCFVSNEQQYCNFNSAEKELFNEDIVQVYSKAPYNCALMGGNMEMRDDRKQTTSDSPVHLTLHSSLLLVTAYLNTFLVK